VRVVRGGSAETRDGRWVKFDVELDESDIQANAVEAGIDPIDLKVADKFLMLSLQAEWLVTLKMETMGVTSNFTAAELGQKFKDHLNKLKEKYSVSS
jgi:hypothetical protein